MKKRLKILILICVCLLAAACFSGSSRAEVSLGADGKGTLTLVYEKAELDGSLAERNAFENHMNVLVGSVNTASGEKDMVTLKEIKENETSFEVKLAFRRIDGIRGVGDFVWSKFSAAVARESETQFLIDKLSNGNLKCSLERHYDGYVGLVSLDRDAADIKISPTDAAGQSVDTEDFYAAGDASSARSYFAAFRLLDTGAISEMRIKTAGKLHYISAGSAAEGNTVTVKPVAVRAEVQRYVQVTDDEGLPVFNADGTPKMQMVVFNEDINCFFGYFVFETSNAGVIVGCIAGGAALIGLILVGIFTGFFKKILKSGVMKRALKYKTLYFMLIPGLIVLLIFNYAPMFGLLISFKDYELLSGFGGSEWGGLKHFKHILLAEDPTIYRIFRNTIYISLIRIATNFPMILLFTLMLHTVKSARAKSAVQTISYLPFFISWVAVGGMMFSILDKDTGMLNKVVELFGGDPVNWYAQSDAWWLILALSSLWKSMGWGTIIYMSALSCIDGELYDACRIDGGGMFRQAITVTLPGIMNVIMLQLILDSANIVRDNYEQIMAMLNGSGAVGDTTTVVGSIGFNAILSGEGYSVATALGLIQGLIGLGLVLLTNKIAKKSGNEGVL